MGPDERYVISLSEAADVEESRIGGKSRKLAQAVRAGLAVPRGFCIAAEAYEAFLFQTRLEEIVAAEVGRKPLDSMRWEEIWDAALRIRSAFLRTSIPPGLVESIRAGLKFLTPRVPLAVRSSAPGEDSGRSSFAGLHESVVGVLGEAAVLDAVRQVWASLWSDAALLYRKELNLDPKKSRMAVLVQEMTLEECSGVAFGRDPRNLQEDLAIIEAVPGECGGLVDGSVDPDRWTIRRSAGEILDWRRGEREPGSRPLLEERDLKALLVLLDTVEALFRWSPDVEWTGRAERLTLLQARPITTAGEPEEGDERAWYLTLRPGAKRLHDLAIRVSEELIPRLEADGERFAAESLDDLDDAALAEAVAARWNALAEWMKVYWDEFIPFAHGVRALARYYNDAVHPDDPYEFVGLLKGERMLASRRNRALASLAARLRGNAALEGHVRELVADLAEKGSEAKLESLDTVGGGAEFVRELQGVLREYFDIAYGSRRLSERLDLILPGVLEMIDSPAAAALASEEHASDGVSLLEERLFDAVGPSRRDEALDMLRIGRLSWRLRDDDNLLVSRIESQLLRAASAAMRRLEKAGRLVGKAEVTKKIVPDLIDALRNGTTLEVETPEESSPVEEAFRDANEKPRQLVGQPAAPGMATGRARRIRGPESIAAFQAGEILVCDAIQPMMTHLVPLAAGIVERRGGMLIHGAIIARELGIPCVNGIPDAVNRVSDAETLTVDGYLGIVTVGPPEFELELRSPS